MALVEGQWQIRDLALGPGTQFRLMDDTNPFMRQARASQGGPRAWAHGGWSGAEWQAEAVVPMRLLVTAKDVAGAIEARHQLAAAFRPAHVDVELRFVLGGREYLMLGRPRMSEPDLSLIGVGRSFVRCAFVAMDPTIYSGALHQATTGLPVQVGGVTVPFTVPLLVTGSTVGGRIDVLNQGTADAPIRLRIDGPAPPSRVALQGPSGAVQTLRLGLDLGADQWVGIDSAARTVLLNGETSVRGHAAFDMDPAPLPPGRSVLRFAAADYSSDARLGAAWRSAWW